MAYRYTNEVLGYYPVRHLAKGEILQENLLERNFKKGDFCYQIGTKGDMGNQIIWEDVKCGAIEREENVSRYDEENDETYDDWVVLRVGGLEFIFWDDVNFTYSNGEWEWQKQRYLVIFEEVEKLKYQEIDIHNVDLESYSLPELKLVAKSRGVRVTKGITKEKLIKKLDKEYLTRIRYMEEREGRNVAVREAKDIAACDKDTGFCAPLALAYSMGIPAKTLNNYLIREGYRQRGDGMSDDAIVWAANHFGFTLKDKTKDFEKFVKKLRIFKQVELYGINKNIPRGKDVCCNLFHFEDFQEFFNPRLSYLIFSLYKEERHISAVVRGQLYDLYQRKERIRRVVEISKSKDRKIQASLGIYH